LEIPARSANSLVVILRSFRASRINPPSKAAASRLQRIPSDGTYDKILNDYGFEWEALDRQGEGRRYNKGSCFFADSHQHQHYR
ncbi:MAG TPA: hypothetical protein VJ936_06555, partial [Desulfobacteraceae bacterium]|nr:hypothetical protein [Desulfobacteraceae bacterium]